MGLFTAQIAYRLVLLPILTLLLRTISLWNSKTRRTLAGHRNVFPRLQVQLQSRNPLEKLVWFHVASAGEYLRIRPLIEQLHVIGWQAVVTYSSASAKTWLDRDRGQLPALLAADFLPLDTRRNMQHMLNMIKPAALVFLRYDLWPNLIWLTQKNYIPQLLFAAALPANTIRHRNPLVRFFYITLYQAFTGIYTISDEDASRYKSYNLTRTEIKTLGDTGFDTVHQRAQSTTLTRPEAWSGKLVTLIGSHWPEDEQVIIPCLQNLLQTHPDMVLIFAPHEISQGAVKRIQGLFNFTQTERWSEQTQFENASAPVFILDTIGQLGQLYKIADIAIVGGAFTTGVHNVMEPAAMGNAILFGPRHHNAQEAQKLIDARAAFCFDDTMSFELAYLPLVQDADFRKQTGLNARNYIQSQTGATQRYMEKLLEHAD